MNTHQLGRVPTPIALAVGILFGFLFARLLPWTTVSNCTIRVHGLAKDVEATVAIAVMLTCSVFSFFFFDLPENEILTMYWLLFSRQHPFGEVVIYPQRHASRVDSLSSYQHLTSALEFLSCLRHYLPIIQKNAHEIPNHSTSNKLLNDTLL